MITIINFWLQYIMYILINTYFDIIFRMTWDTCYFYGSKWDLITTANSFKCQLQVKENFKIMTVLYLFTIIILNTTQAAMQLYVYLQQCIATDLLPFDNKNAERRAVHLNVTLIWYAKSNICTYNIANCVYTTNLYNKLWQLSDTTITIWYDI